MNSDTLGANSLIGNCHMAGFGREAIFKTLFLALRRHYPDLKMGQLQAAIAAIAPGFASGLFTRRACTRELRYVGRRWSPDVPEDDAPFLRDEIYESTSFNGATYTFREYCNEAGEQPIGMAYFECVEEQANQ